ncbi:DUF3560 domain-containing protein [Fodinicola acaciae]|uniref:DUF3560 domain-containing protein n=1 Tax=Fodinicola acaciae TaxID=2681555 RepID=UPI0013D22FBC|nr:DUF3560 domain-containing protein [Fodinicola acaciae]
MSTHPHRDNASESASTIVITHTHADGTLIHGSSKGDGVLELAYQHGFTYRRSVGIFIRGSRDKDANQPAIQGLADALRAVGHRVEIEIDNTWRSAAEREADRAARVDARVERLAERADRAAYRSARSHARAQAIADLRPLGQPTQVGHHSERRSRRDQERINAGDRRGWDEAAYAAHLSQRAEGAAANEAAKASGPAIMRRIDKLEAEQRKIQRYRDQCADGSPGQQKAQREIDRLADDIGHQRDKLAQMASDGTFVAWTPAHFTPGDHVRVLHRWYAVTRVNKKTLSLNSTSGPRTAPMDEITGRRRDGQQWDTPHGQPWPVELATKVAAWRQLHREADSRSSDHTDLLRHMRYAQRLVHGLDLTAPDAELAALHRDRLDVDAQRSLAATYLAVYRRLEAGEPVPDIRVSLTIVDLDADWRIPASEPTLRLVTDVRPGDLIKGSWERGPQDSYVHRSITGLVAAVSEPIDRHEAGTWITITLTDGAEYPFKTHRWLAIFPNYSPHSSSANESSKPV